jgi:hypothetical protein
MVPNGKKKSEMLQASGIGKVQIIVAIFSGLERAKTKVSVEPVEREKGKEAKPYREIDVPPPEWMAQIDDCPSH